MSTFAERFRTSERWADFREQKAQEDARMLALIDPPERYRSQYEKVLRQHGFVARLLALLEKPTGSLASYTAEVRSLAANYDQLKAELDVSLPPVGESKQSATTR